jgi:glycerol-3-phosphate O-acyltransferase
MATRITITGLKSMFWYFNKTMRIAIQGLHVSERSLENVKKHLSDGNKVVLMPIYKSFADAIIYVYIHMRYNLEAPFIFGNLEDTPDIKLFNMWLKKVGYIYSRRTYKSSVQSRYINSSMLKEIIENNKLTMVF